nr:MAG TPA: hypothetical protein [Caudoviricetes sp.]
MFGNLITRRSEASIRRRAKSKETSVYIRTARISWLTSIRLLREV